MQDYKARDATQRAAEVRRKFPSRTPRPERDIRPPKARRVSTSSIDLRRGNKETTRGRGPDAIELGRERVDLSYLEQLAEAGQTEAIARVIGDFVRGGTDREVGEIAGEAMSVAARDLDSLGGFRGHPGELSLPRVQEVCAALNRVRFLGARPG